MTQVNQNSGKSGWTNDSGRIFILIGVIALAAIIVFGAVLQYNDPEAQYKRAQTAQREGRWNKAVELYRKSAAQGYHQAEFALAGMVYDRDKSEAAVLYENACKAGVDIGEIGCLRVAEYYYSRSYITIAENWYNDALNKCRSKPSADSSSVSEAHIGLGNCYFAEKNYSSAVDNYIKAREAEFNADAYYGLGCCYWYGRSRSVDAVKGAELVDKAYEKGKKGDPNLCWAIAERYYSGDGLTKSYDDAFKWYERSAEQGGRLGMTGLGNCYYYGYGCDANKKKAVELWSKAAEKGDKLAQYWLARSYLKGDGAETNKAAAKKWYAESAANDDSDYPNKKFDYENLANLYFNDGEYSDAIKWYEDCLNRNIGLLSQGYFNLAESHWKKNHKSKAVDYYETAYGKGVKNARSCADIAEYHWSNKEYYSCVKWAKRGAEEGNSDAQFRLGVCYERGLGGLSQDWRQAAYWDEKAADQGHKTAMNNLAVDYYNLGEYSRAFRAAERAVEHGQVSAKKIMADCYLCGNGVTENEALAVKLYEEVAEANVYNSGEAYKQLAKCYEYGWGVLKNSMMANYYRDKANACASGN